ncbi:carbohydrate sulfotransferase 13-like [Babylonia areolata]|uniref:carbohydrate sulfotransferase 13-like n=1 Tax=Babylonia areolata TaxID=304850 RepID=UPI003FD477CE
MCQYRADLTEESERTPQVHDRSAWSASVPAVTTRGACTGSGCAEVGSGSGLQRDAVNSQRLQHLRAVCSQNRSHYIPAARRNKIESLEEFLVDVPHGLSYCYIPKVGSSTLKRVFHILTGRNHGRPLFSLSGRHIHRNRSGKYHVLGTVLEGETLVRRYQVLRSLRKVLFVRDPYERIFSAYVDRLFGVAENLYSLFPALMKDRSTAKDFALDRNSCDSVNVTFSDVIRYVIRTPVTELDEHFGPYYTICFPCHVDYDYVGKLETFRHDVSVILTSVGVDPHSVLGDDVAFDAQNDVNILHDVAERTFEMLETYYFRHCFTKYRMLKRTWVSFQEAAEGITLTQFDDLVKDKYLKVTNRSRVKGQRGLAMKEAFHSLPRDLLRQLQEVVQRDCDLFGYDCSVEARFKESEQLVPVFHFDQL